MIKTNWISHTWESIWMAMALLSNEEFYTFIVGWQTCFGRLIMLQAHQAQAPSIDAGCRWRANENEAMTQISQCLQKAKSLLPCDLEICMHFTQQSLLSLDFVHLSNPRKLLYRMSLRRAGNEMELCSSVSKSHPTSALITKAPSMEIRLQQL